MGAMKNLTMDICYFKRKGYSVEEISKMFGMSVDEVNETLDMHYDLIIGKA